MDRGKRFNSKLTRRNFLNRSAVAGGSLWLTSKVVPKLVRRAEAWETEPLPGGTLDPRNIPKYARPLVVPPAMPRTGSLVVSGGKSADYYEIAVRQFRQEIVPGKQTTVWSYGSINHPGTVAEGGTFNYPALTIEATWRKPVRVKWINGLVDGSGKFLPHLLPVDPTLHWANPPGGVDGRDTQPKFSATPARYTGPVPIVTHVHGHHGTDHSDGYAEAWYLPAAGNIPPSFAKAGTWYYEFSQQFLKEQGVAWDPGTATFQYSNDQPATTMWYHDHTLGITRLNVYAGPAGFYLLRGGPFDADIGVLPGPAPQEGDAPGMKYFDVPIVVQDRSFNDDGSLFYPDSRKFFDDFSGPFIPSSDVPPIWNPEFFGNTVVVNGRAWPSLDVEPRRYRFRFLNGCNSRFLILKMVVRNAQDAPPRDRPVAGSSGVLPFWRIGADGGFLPAAVQQDAMLLAPAERADVVVDFTAFAGNAVFLINEGPDEPFPSDPDSERHFADPDTTGQVMKFVVGTSASHPEASLDPASQAFHLPGPVAIGPASVTRQVALGEIDSEVLTDVGPVAVLLGQLARGSFEERRWEDAITENPALGATEIWEIYNFTQDAHPIHVHEVQFQVVGRQPFLPFGGPARPPEPWERGVKDTFIAYPGEITRIKALFDEPGRFVWHCHILEHEDNEMMRPYTIGPDFVPRQPEA